MAMVEVSVVPIGARATDPNEYINRVLATLPQKNLWYEQTAMGVIITGELHEIWSTMREIHECCFSADVTRVLTHIRIDDRRDREARAGQKVLPVFDVLNTL
jgi:uncharacterized protein (TIGR00106 family)